MIKLGLLTTLFLLMSEIQVFAQKDPTFVDANWTIGTVKKVTRSDSTITISAGEVFADLTSSINYQIKVLSYKEGMYELAFQKFEKKNHDSFVSDFEEATVFWQIAKEMLDKLSKLVTDFDYVFIVDQESGQAVAVQNEAQLMAQIEEAADITFNSLIEAMGVQPSQAELDEAIEQMSSILSDQYEQIIQTIINEFNYVFQAYSTPYLPNSTFLYETEVYDIDATQNNTSELMEIEVKASQKGNILTLNRTYLYDKKAYYDANYRNSSDYDFNFEDFDVSETTKTVFDLKTSWIKSSESKVYVKMGEVEMRVSTTLVFR